MGICCFTGISKAKDGLFISAVCCLAGNTAVKMQCNLPFILSHCDNLVMADVMFFQGNRRFHHCDRIDFDHLVSTHTHQRVAHSGAKHTHTYRHTLLVTLIMSMYHRYTVSNKAIDISLITGIGSLWGIHAEGLRHLSASESLLCTN